MIRPDVANRSIHYEAAFEAYLRGRGTPYVAIDEAKRALFGTTKLKGFDFLVHGKRGNLLVDVKGRKFTEGRSMQTWVTEADVRSLLEWEQVFGSDFRAVFAFTFWIDPQEPVQMTFDGSADLEGGVFRHLDRWYRVLVVGLKDYSAFMRPRSGKWETVALPTPEFRSLAVPLEHLL